MDVETDGIFLETNTILYDNDYKADLDSNDRDSVWIPVLFSVVLVVGLIGNAILLWVLLQRRGVWRLSDTCVFHFSMADVLLLMTLPVWTAAGIQEEWIYGLPLCKIVVAVHKINFYCGISILLCISFKRYLAIVHKKHCKNRWLTKLIFLFVWIIPIFLTIPDWVALAFKRKDPWVGKGIKCVPNCYNPTGWLGSRVLHIILFVISTLITCYSSIRIWLHNSCKYKQKKTSDIINLTLVSVFIVCWTPYNITLIWDTVRSNSEVVLDVYKDPTSESAMEVSLTITFALSCVHACLRPLLYFGLCRTFRACVLDVYRCKSIKSTRSMWELGVCEENLPSQSHEGEDLEHIGCNEHQLQTIQC